jgi:hypothetical protein
VRGKPSMFCLITNEISKLPNLFDRFRLDISQEEV